MATSKSAWRLRLRSVCRSARSAWREAMPLYRLLVIFGLAGVAITQPVLDLLGSNPEFFVAGGYTRRQIVLVAVAVVLLPSLVVASAVGLMALVGRGLGTGAYRVAVGLLAGLFALVLSQQVGVENLIIVGVLVGAAGVGLAWFERSVTPLRMFLSYLCIGNLLFLGLFLFSSGTAELLAAGSWSPASRGQVELPELDGPVVVLVLDEFPVASILRSDGTINETRYPGFARLADSSTFFRNASSRQIRTHVAVPEMLTGKGTTDVVLPTYKEYPRNLFTLFGPDLPVDRYEIVTDLCPPAICPPRASGGLDQALRDSAVIYGHRALPPYISDYLPSVDNSWGNFDEIEEGAGGGDSAALAKAGDDALEDAAFDRWYDLAEQGQNDPMTQSHVIDGMAQGITPDPALHLIHVALPHGPWRLGPDTTQLVWEPPEVEDPEAPNYDWYWRQAYQRHVMQVGAVDEAVDRLIDGMQEDGSWDDALVIVTSDHGTSFLPPDYDRLEITEHNRDGVLRVPLFIKAPGQAIGAVSDDEAQTIDVVPSIVDLLGIETDWDFDGHSLFDGSRSGVEPEVSPGVQPVLDMAEQFEEMFPYGDDWRSIAAVGEHGDLVGTQVTDLYEGSPSEWGWSVDQHDILARREEYGDQVPRVIGGKMRHGDSEKEPPEFVVALNGTIAGVAGGHVPAGTGRWEYTAFLADFFKDRDNEVTAYEVERGEDGVILHPLTDAD